MEIRRLHLDEWGQRLPSSGFDVFHRPEALAAMDDHTDAAMYLLGAFKGEEPVGLLPVFVQKNVIGSVVYSPPPSMGIPYGGPLLLASSPKRRKIERVNREFTRTVLEELGAESRFSLFRMLGCPAYTDPRPFRWAGQRIETRFTYVLEVPEEPDQLLGRFSSDLRSEIKNLRDSDLQVSVGGEAATRRVTRDVISRYEEQGESAPITPGYVCDLVESLGAYARTYIARDAAGNYRGGVIVLFSNDTACYWQGGVSSTYEGYSVNSLLHWRVVQDIANDSPVESVNRYDLIGANVERLSNYKAKFNPDLVPYYLVESSGPGMTVAKTAYGVLNK